jgi:Zn-dependent M28 family amino/carboxypeptidase
LLSVSSALSSCTPAPSEPTAQPSAEVSAPASVAPVASAAPKRDAGADDPLSVESLGAHVKFLCSDELRGREAGSEGERRALDDTAARLRALGLEPERQKVPIRNGESANLYATLRGTVEETIVLGAHIDHLGVRDGKLYCGAEDNASGVALVMGVVARLKKERLERAVTVVFFGAEEIGLVGSRRFVAPMPPLGGPVVVMINIDMIGRRLADDPRYILPKRLLGVDDRRAVAVLGTRDRPAFRQAVDAAFGKVELSAIGLEDLPPAMARVAERISDGRGDSFSFEAVGVPSLFFSSGESIDYHQSSDTPERLDLDLMSLRGRAIAELVVTLAKKSTRLPGKSAAAVKP